MEKAEKTTGPFRYNLKVPYDYTVEVTNRCKGLDLIERVPEELWTEIHNIVEQAVIKTVPKRKNCKKAKWLPEEALPIKEKRRSKRQRRKGKIYPSECKVLKNNKES